MNKTKVSSYLFILPAFIIYVSVIVLPTLDSFRISLHRWSGMDDMVFVGLSNYTQLIFYDPVFQVALRNNLAWIAMTLGITVPVALMLALLLNAPIKGRTFFRAVYYFPAVLSGIMVAIIWRWIYNPTFGIVNELLSLVGLDAFRQTFLGDPNRALVFVFIASLWAGAGHVMILFLAGLQTIPSDVIESAQIDGAGSIRQFFSIKLPLLKETFIIVFATLIIASMQVFAIIMGTTAGGPANSTQVLATYMVQQTFTFSNMGMGAAISTLMLIMMMVIVIPYVLYATKER